MELSNTLDGAHRCSHSSCARHDCTYIRPIDAVSSNYTTTAYRDIHSLDDKNSVLATTFFMNFVKLRRGEAVYIGADEVHAYLEGDIIECMAVSDNVLNAAFAPAEEARAQVPPFIEMLTYTARPAAHWALPSRAFAAHTRAYDPPLEEFVVLGTTLRSGKEGTEDLEAVAGPMIGIVTRGQVHVRLGHEEMELKESGLVYVVPGNIVEVRLLQADADGEGEVWWAACMA